MLKLSRSTLVVIAFSLLTICGEIGQIVWLPLWVDSTDNTVKTVGDEHHSSEGSGAYSVVLISSVFSLILFLILYLLFSKSKNYRFGKIFALSCILNSFAGLLTPYVSSSARNPPLIQAALVNAYVPLTVLLRFFWLRKLPTVRKGICVIVVVVSLVIALMPDFLGEKIEASEASETKPSSGNEQFVTFLWIMGFVIFQVFIGILTNLCMEKLLKTPEVSSSYRLLQQSQSSPSTDDMEEDEDAPLEVVNQIELPNINSTPDVFYVCLVMGMIQLISAIVFFWVDLIPSFGYSSNIYQFVENIKHTSLCTIGKDGCDYQTTWFALGFVLSFVASFIGGFSLILYGEGSTFWSLVENMVPPSAIVFWMLFLPEPLRWFPHFDKMKWFCISSLIIMLPAVIIYNYGEAEHTYKWVHSNIRTCGYTWKKMKIIREEEVRESSTNLENIDLNILI